MNLNYRQLCSEESFGAHGSFGIQILATLERELTNEEYSALRKAKAIVESAIREENLRRDPEAQARAKEEREELLGLFPQPIFVETIPNGYCSDWCCKHLPWFIVTTTRGRVTIGWRKSVIAISWDECVAPKAEMLFPSEGVTKSDRMIHAHGIEHARRYVETILK